MFKIISNEVEESANGRVVDSIEGLGSAGNKLEGSLHELQPGTLRSVNHFLF